MVAICGCHLDPVDDRTTPCDLCSEATGMEDGTGWKIVRCPLHDAAQELLDALQLLWSSSRCEPIGHDGKDVWLVSPDALNGALAVIKKASRKGGA